MRPDLDVNRKFRYAWREAVISKDEPNGLSPTQRLVALAFCEHVNNGTLEGFPGPAALARRTGLSPRAVKDALRALVAAGWLFQVKKGGSHPGNRETSVYRLTRALASPVQEETGSGGAPVQERTATRAGDSTTRAPVAHRPISNPVNEPRDEERAEDDAKTAAAFAEMRGRYPKRGDREKVA